MIILSYAGCNVEKESNRFPDQPNIILILADDLGYSDLGCFGSLIRTPHIDNLAANGVVFSQFYNAGRCCPSRASLMTGVYPHEAGIGHMMKDYGQESYRGNLSKNVITIAEALKLVDYHTFMVGKWHLTNQMDPEGDQSNWPTNRGFDQYYGTLDGFTSFFDPVGLVEGTSSVPYDSDFYYTDAIADKAIEYMNSVPEDEPFFIYVANMAPHFPLHAKEEKIKKYQGVFDDGWDVLRQNRFDKLIQKGLIAPQTPLSGRDPMSVAWEDEEFQDWQLNRMEVFAAMIDHMDENVGKIIEAVKDRGELENTLILFMSDNGGSAEGHLNGKVERLGTPWTSRVIPDTTSEGQKVLAGDFPGQNLGGPETFGSYGPKWSNLSNTPFRLHKSWMHEGGISSPFIAYWPKEIEDVGRIVDEPCHLIDILATIVDIAEINYPEEYKGHKIKPMSGISLMPAIRKNSLESRKLYWEHEGNKAIRTEKWKLVAEYPGAWEAMKPYPYQGEWELYDIEMDRTETNNLATEYPQVVDSLSGDWKNWAEKVGVISMDKLQELGFKN